LLGHACVHIDRSPTHGLCVLIPHHHLGLGRAPPHTCPPHLVQPCTRPLGSIRCAMHCPCAWVTTQPLGGVSWTVQRAPGTRCGPVGHPSDGPNTRPPNLVQPCTRPLGSIRCAMHCPCAWVTTQPLGGVSWTVQRAPGTRCGPVGHLGRAKHTSTQPCSTLYKAIGSQ